MTEIREIEAKSILVKSNLPDTDFVINPYTGCEFGCAYCYASFMCRYVGRDVSDWGNFVYIKKNAAEILDKELSKLKDNTKTIFFSSVTDPYQGVESQFKLTQNCLKVLLNHHYQGRISILTKSALVARDIDLFKQFKNIEIGLTITSTTDTISRFLEGKSSSVSHRLETLKKLNESGLKTYSFVGPLLPHFSLYPEQLDDLFKQIAATGTKEVYVEQLNMKPSILAQLKPFLDDQKIQEVYANRSKVNLSVHQFLKQYGLFLRLNQVIVHKDLKV